MIAAGYGNVYVAQIALGADNAQTVKALAEAESWHGPSLIIAYSTCIEHGIDMATSMTHQKEAAAVRVLAALPLRPAQGRRGGARRSSSTATRRRSRVKEFQAKEARFAMLARSRPAEFEVLQQLAQADAEERRRFYEQLAGVERHAPGRVDGNGHKAEPPAETKEGTDSDAPTFGPPTWGSRSSNPLVPSASTLSSRIDTLKRLQDAGASAVVMQSLFEEQIEHEELQIHRMLETGSDSNPESLTHFPELEDYNTGPDEYLRHLEASQEGARDPGDRLAERRRARAAGSATRS